MRTALRSSGITLRLESTNGRRDSFLDALQTQTAADASDSVDGTFVDDEALILAARHG